MKLVFAALLVCASATGFAQTPSVGTLGGIQGLVSVSTNGVVTNATAATSLSNGSVVLNSSNGSSLVNLSNGCSVALKPNQVLTINSAASCSELTASVKTISIPVAEGAGSGGWGLGSPFFVAAGVVGGAVILNNVTKNKVSGS